MTDSKVPRYGVLEQTQATTASGAALEEIRRVGYAVVGGAYSDPDRQSFADAFDRAFEASNARYSRSRLVSLGEHNTIRALLAHDSRFLALAMNERVLPLVRALLGEYILLNQQNGVSNPPGGERYSQEAFHRDLPYQHYVSSRPLAISALYCVDPFTEDSGATVVIPASHRDEAFPSDRIVENLQRSICAPAGSFIVFDSMLYHRGGTNASRTSPRRAVNHLYTIPFFKQQIDLPAALGEGYTTSPEARRLLGYDDRPARSVEEYYASRKRE